MYLSFRLSCALRFWTSILAAELEALGAAQTETIVPLDSEVGDRIEWAGAVESERNVPLDSSDPDRIEEDLDVRPIVPSGDDSGSVSASTLAVVSVTVSVTVSIKLFKGVGAGFGADFLAGRNEKDPKVKGEILLALDEIELVLTGLDSLLRALPRNKVPREFSFPLMSSSVPSLTANDDDGSVHSSEVLTVIGRILFRAGGA